MQMNDDRWLPPRTPATDPAPPAPDGTFEAALSATGLPILALDLRGVPAETPASWFRDPHPTRNIGAGYRIGGVSTK